jgi:hypothetical protein
MQSGGHHQRGFCLVDGRHVYERTTTHGPPVALTTRGAAVAGLSTTLRTQVELREAQGQARMRDTLTKQGATCDSRLGRVSSSAYIEFDFTAALS